MRDRVEIAPEVVRPQEEEHAASRLPADEILLFGRRCPGKEQGRAAGAGGATRTQRLSCSGWYVSSTSVKWSFSQKNAIASS